MDWTCCMYGSDKVMHRGLWCGNLTEGDHLEDLGVDGSVTLVGLKEIE
jgi:hypothetical protein